MNTTALKAKNVFQILIIVGLICIVVANQFDCTIFGCSTPMTGGPNGTT